MIERASVDTSKLLVEPDRSYRDALEGVAHPLLQNKSYAAVAIIPDFKRNRFFGALIRLSALLRTYPYLQSIIIPVILFCYCNGWGDGSS